MPIINSLLKPLLLAHIKENSIKKGIFIDSMTGIVIDTFNCVKDHIHLIVSLGTEQTISNIAKLIKGESSYWVNHQKIITQKFEWQDDYIAISISETSIEAVRQYIRNQEEHHKKITFNQEYNQFLEIHGIRK